MEKLFCSQKKKKKKFTNSFSRSILSTFKYVLPTTSGGLWDAVIIDLMLSTEDSRDVLEMGFDRLVFANFCRLAVEVEAGDAFLRLFSIELEAGDLSFFGSLSLPEIDGIRYI